MGNILTLVLDYLGVKHTRAYADEVLTLTLLDALLQKGADN